MSSFTAALGNTGMVTQDGWCDICVIINDEDGEMTSELALNVVRLPVRVPPEGDLDEAETAAIYALREHGWQVYGPWLYADTAAYAEVVRIGGAS